MRCGGEWEAAGRWKGAKYLHTQTLGAFGGMEVLLDWRNEGAEVDPLAAAKWPSSNLSQVIRRGRQFFAPAIILLIINASLKCSGGFIIANEAATQLRNLKNYTENMV